MRRRRRSLQDIKSSPLLACLLALSIALKGTHAAIIPKCCPPLHVLNYELRECIIVPDKAAIHKVLEGVLPLGSSRDSNLLLAACPLQNRSELSILRRIQNGFVVKQPLLGDDTTEVEIEDSDHSQELLCVDAALNYALKLEGPFLYTCSSNVTPEAIGNVNKCCPLGSDIEPRNGSCVANTRSLPFQLPRRFVKHEATQTFTQSYLVNTQQPVENEEDCTFLSSIQEIYSNGRLSFGGKNVVEYSCIDRSPRGGDFYAKICRRKQSEACTEGITCIPKCCELDEVFHYSNSRCVKVVDGSMLYFPQFHDAQGKPSPAQQPSADRIRFKAFHMEHLVRRECSKGLYKVNDNENIRLLEDGSLYHEGYGVSRSGFCVDNFVRSIRRKTPPIFSAVKCVEIEDSASSNFANRSNTGIVNNVKLSACESKMSRFNVVLRIVYTACGACSLLFLILTFAIYSLLPNFRNLHGKIVMSNILAIFLTTLFLIIAYNSKTTNRLVCVWTGYSLYYSGLSMFCWMSVMCFDLCWTFVRAKIPRKGSDRLKFCIYSIFAWTVPGIFCGLIGGLDSWSKSLAPHVGKYNCFLNMKAARMFFYFPIFILLCFNVIMYLITIGTLWRSKQSSKKAGLTKSVGHRIQNKPGSLNNNSSHRRSQNLSTRRTRKGGHFSHINVEIREQLLLFTKLFLIMGITWISECIHIEIHGDHNNLEDCNFYLEVFLRIIGGLNMLRGFGFFVIFICKRSIYKSLQKKYPNYINILSSCPCIRSKQLPSNVLHSPQGGGDIQNSPRTPKTNETELNTFTSKKLLQKKRNDGRGSRTNILQESV